METKPINIKNLKFPSFFKKKKKIHFLQSIELIPSLSQGAVPTGKACDQTDTNTMAFGRRGTDLQS